MSDFRRPLRPSGGSAPVEESDQDNAKKAKSGEAFTCEECGAELENMDHRRKHAYQHWGNGQFPPFAGYDTARSRYAALVGSDTEGAK